MGEVVSLDVARRARAEIAEADQRARQTVLGLPVIEAVCSPPFSLTVTRCPYCAPDEQCVMHSPTAGDLGRNLYFPPRPGVHS